MLAILLIGLVSACAAAPRFGHGPPPYHPQPMESRPSFFDPLNSEFFETRQFWEEMANEMRDIDTMLQQFYKSFPAVVSSTQGIENGKYKITIPLNGFQEKEIVVKAREGVLMVQAVHKTDGGENSYLDIKTLPACVNVTGTWQFEEGVLKIVFPVKQDALEGEQTGESDKEGVTEAPVTEHSREDLAPREDDNADTDADVGARGDQGISNSELFTNEIPRSTVEATTYSVDLNDEIEFVPVRYQQRRN